MKVKRAVLMIKISDYKMEVPTAMRNVQFSDAEASNRSMQQRVRRAVERSKTVPLLVEAAIGQTNEEVSTLGRSLAESLGSPPPLAVVSVSTSSVAPKNLLSTFNERQKRYNSRAKATTPADLIKESKIRLDEMESSRKPAERKKRRTLAQSHSAKAAKKTQTDTYSRGMKIATLRVNENKKLPAGHPDKAKSNEAIVMQVNEEFGCTLATSTVNRKVRQGEINVTPTKCGPRGDFDKATFLALTGAFSSFLKIEEANGKRQPTAVELKHRIHACVNRAGYSKSGRKLYERLTKETAGEFFRAKAQLVEQRRLLWTTHTNLDLWFNVLERTLLDYGFAQIALPSDAAEGSLVFNPHQLHRIVNFDETAAELDNTSTNKGGRPAGAFYSYAVGARGATMASKTGYSMTIICGSTAAGDPLPPHFQLRSEAESSRQKIDKAFIAATADVVGTFGYPTEHSHPCTFGMNEKAGMNEVELMKYIKKAILPLWPDVADRPGKRLILKVDSGPGRMNMSMLAELRLLGVYLVPGVPNTTHVTQETDQNYGPFKTYYRTNLELLAEYRFGRHETLKMNDIPLLVFGAELDGLVLSNAFEMSFSRERNLACWRKVGAVPLTRACLASDQVRREVVINSEGSYDLTVDPEVALLHSLAMHNRLCCDLLASSGFDADQLRNELSKVDEAKKRSAVTAPRSRERQDALMRSRSAGNHFHHTNGEHLNSDDVFIANQRRENETRIQHMEQTKSQRLTFLELEQEAARIVAENDLSNSLVVNSLTVPELKSLLQWKTQSKLKPKGKKADLLDAWKQERDKPSPCKGSIWTDEEEATLQRLRDGSIELGDTQLGVAVRQQAQAVATHVDLLSNEDILELEEAMRQRAIREHSSITGV